MTPQSTPDPLFIVAWAFVVKPEQRRDFERAYGPNGDWVHLFRTGEGYIKTELHRDPQMPGRYITLDFWRTRQQYEAFREQSKLSYQEIDARFERLTDSEQLLGDFSDLESLHKALPKLGAATQVAPRFTIRPVNKEDIAEIIRLEQAAPTAAHWTQEAYDAIGRDDAPARIALIAESAARKLCGFIVARIIADECEIENIAVRTSELRRGIGSALLHELARIARTRGIRRLILEVRESNSPAHGLYEKLGFQCDGERSSYYSDPAERAILYSRTL
jgi:ribosomal-protein-alanine N-acetyltransferase